MADTLQCFPFVRLLSPRRAKPAGNSNDTGGVEESDLDKMKQVRVFASLLTCLNAATATPETPESEIKRGRGSPVLQPAGFADPAGSDSPYLGSRGPP